MKIYWSSYTNDYIFQPIPNTFYRLENDLTGGCFWISMSPGYLKDLELFSEVEL